MFFIFFVLFVGDFGLKWLPRVVPRCCPMLRDTKMSLVEKVYVLGFIALFRMLLAMSSMLTN